MPDAGAPTRRGQRSDVVLDVAAGVVRRYPRTVAAWQDLELSAARFTAARAAGMPAPALVEVVPGPLGSAHLVLTLVGGVGLSPTVTTRFGVTARDRLVADLVALLATLRRADPLGWPGAPTPWAQRWATLGQRLVKEVVPLLEPGPGAVLARRDVALAVAAAGTVVERGLAHGDLGGENVHLDPSTGRVLGVLDWDEAGPGDPAVDLAAIRAHAEPWLREGLLGADPSLGALISRAEAYIGTFALQEALWGLESGDPDAVDAGLAGYR